MFDRLHDEWTQWSRSVRGAQTLLRWAIDDHPLRGWTLAELASPRSSPRTDAMQAVLVRRAQGGERAAFVALVAQLRPGLISMVRWARATDPRLRAEAEAEDEVLATFSEVVVAHDLARRPEKIAANLLSDTRQRLWRARTSRAKVDAALAEPPPAPARPVEHAPEDRALELDLTGAVSSALDELPGTDRSRRLTAELAYRAWILDHPNDRIGADLGVGAQVVRTRLCRLRSTVRAQHAMG